MYRVAHLIYSYFQNSIHFNNIDKNIYRSKEKVND